LSWDWEWLNLKKKKLTMNKKLFNKDENTIVVDDNDNNSDENARKNSICLPRQKLTKPKKNK